MRLLAVLLLALSITSQAGTLKVAAEDAWPPFSDSQGKGYSRELATAAFQSAGITLEVQTVPYARALSMTSAGETDACWNVTRQPSTEATFVFGEVPLFQATASYYYKTGQQRDYRRPADIPDGTRIAVINGYEYGSEFERHRRRFNLIEVSKQKQILSLLVNERVDMAIFFDRVFDYTMAHSHLDRSLFIRGELNHVSDIYIAFSPANPQSEKYARLLDDGLRTLKANGEYDRIMGNSTPVL
ncbi:MAG: transporter substrate-binding domain-containing protein [Pseudomonadota bacterium]|nr:transporter substrate-binding domain-containing protein [Pseudomonadota bacterium]